MAKAQANYERRKAAAPENDWKRWLATVKVRDDAEPFTVEELEGRVQVWAGWQEFLDEVRRLMGCGFFNEEEAPPSSPPPQDPPPSDPQPTQQCVTDAAWNAAVNGLGGTTNAGHAKALYRALLTFKQHERTNASLPAWPAQHGTEPTSTITAQEVRDAKGSGTWGGWDHIIAALECVEAGSAQATQVVVVEPEPETPPMPQTDNPFCRALRLRQGSGPATATDGTITMKATGGWPGSVDERASINLGIEIEVDICNIGFRNSQTEIDLSDEGTGICVDHLKIDGWTRKDLPGQPVRWCGLVADGGGVKAGWTVEGNKSGSKPDVYAEGARGRITFRGTVLAYDDGVVRGDRTLGSLRAYFNRAVGVNDSGGHAQGDYGFVNSLPNRTVRDQDAAVVSLERRYVYGGPHHGWNYVVDVDKPIVTRGSSPTSTPEYWTMAITAGGKGFWVRVPSGRTFSGATHDALPLASLDANMGGKVRTMKEWCGRSESERGNMQYASVKVQGIVGPDPSRISFSELAAGADLCNP